MKETNTKKKDNKENLTEIQELLKQLDSLLTETYETHQYTHTVEITNLSRKLQDKKLNDEFFISNLTEKENLRLCVNYSKCQMLKFELKVIFCI